MADRPGEFELISRLFAPLAADAGAFALTDDACLLQPRHGHDLVVTADALVEGVHFLPSDAPDLVARKALRVNLSDLAAKGAEPAGYLLVLSLPERIDMAWLEAFAAGLREDQKAYAVSLLGGDTTSTPGPLTLAVTALGHVPSGAMIRRAGAQPGDDAYVSGMIGDAGGGLSVLTGASPAWSGTHALVRRYHLPEPRLALGKALRSVATAALDVSDGLIADFGHVAQTSGVRIVVEADRVPLSQALKDLWGDSPEAVARAATAGDDYELAFTARPGSAVTEAGRLAGIPVTRVGRVESGAGVTLVDAAGREIPLARTGFRHF